MIHTLSDLQDSITYEKLVLASIFPLVDMQSRGASLDIRHETETLTIPGVNFGVGLPREFEQVLRPLFFASAWKILDLVVEYGLRDLITSNRPTFHNKAECASRAEGLPPLSTDPELWKRISSLYRNTVEARHCLVHRRFKLQPNGDMTDLFDEHGATCKDVTADDQVEFCRLAQRIACIAQRQCMSPRERLDLVASLDALMHHHQYGSLGGGEPARKPAIVLVNAQYSGRAWSVNTIDALSKAKQSMPGHPYYDIEVYFPGVGIPPLRGRLEEAPQGPNVIFDPSDPPEWMDE